MYNIKKMRKAKGLSQNQLAELIGVHQTAVSQWESERTLPSGKTLARLLTVLGCSYEELTVGGVEDERKKAE